MSVCVFVADIPEFASVVAAARTLENARLHAPRKGYWCIESDRQLQFERKPMKLGPALWYSMLSGGFRGRIVEFGRDRLIIGTEGA